MDPAQVQLAQRRLLNAIRRFHRREPLRGDLRVDTLIAEVRAADPPRASAHRGRQPLALTDADLRAVIDELVRTGTMLRQGHRVRLAEAPPAMDPTMRARVDLLVTALRDAGAAPPPAEVVAARLGLPSALLDQLRAAGDLVALGPRIDVPRAGWAEMSARLDRLAAAAPLSVRLVRDQLQTTRRHAEAILQEWNRSRSSE